MVHVMVAGHNPQQIGYHTMMAVVPLLRAIDRVLFSVKICVLQDSVMIHCFCGILIIRCAPRGAVVCVDKKTQEPIPCEIIADYNFSEEGVPVMVFRGASMTGLAIFMLFLVVIFSGMAFGSNNDKNQALREACENGNLEQVRRLLSQGADPNTETPDWTPLMLASGEGHAEIVKVLLTEGADINAKTNDNETALIRAAKWGHAEIVTLLLDKGADVNARLKNGWTALFWPSLDGRADIVKRLFDEGADVDAKTEDGGTALMLASGFGQGEIVKLLLDKGADINAKNREGRTALTWASMKGKTEVVDLLKARGAKE